MGEDDAVAVTVPANFGLVRRAALVAELSPSLILLAILDFVIASIKFLFITLLIIKHAEHCASSARIKR